MTMKRMGAVATFTFLVGWTCLQNVQGLLAQKEAIQGERIDDAVIYDHDPSTKLGTIRSYDDGATWTDYETLDGDFSGYPCSTAVTGETNYVMIDSSAGPHVLYVSKDDGHTWHKRSALTRDDDKWYGTMTIMGDGRLLGGAYTEKDEHNFYYCISGDEGRTWEPQKRAYMDKMIRDPELAYIGGKYYVQGRSGQVGEGSRRFVLYQSDDGIKWGSGVIISGDSAHPDGYSQNCIPSTTAPAIPAMSPA